MSRDAARKYVKLFRETGQYNTYNEIHDVNHGRKKKYDGIDLLILKYLIKKNSTLYLDEIRDEMIRRRRNISQSQWYLEC